MTEKTIIGRNATVDFIDEVFDVPAKVDTGADSSAVWATDIFVDDKHRLHYKLFGEGSPYYTGREHIVSEYSVASTKSSLGNSTIKFRVKMLVKIGDRTVRASFGLSDRSTHNYPILIGRRTLHGKFLVDVEQSCVELEHKREKSQHLNAELKKNPHEFYKRYFN